jgi:nucleoside-diphosphate-sugar epimerase
MSAPKLHVLVTGGAGYLGSVLVPQLLTHGHSVRVLDCLRYGGRSLLGVWSHPDFDFIRGDIRDPATVRRGLRGVDAVVHLAAIVGDPACARAPEDAESTNLAASIDLLRASRESAVPRFVFASTCSNYGRMSDPDALVDETSSLYPLSLYARTKVAVEEMLLAEAGDEFCATPLRFATIFGVSPRMRFDLTVNEFTSQMVTRRHLVVFGEQFWRPYVHVRDAAAAICCVLTAPARVVSGQVFNVGSSEQNYRKQQIVDLVRREVPEGTVEYVAVNEDPRDYRVSFAKIQQELAFHTTTSVAQGVAEVAHLVRDGIVQDSSDASYRN